jgi:hypothetical protein
MHFNVDEQGRIMSTKDFVVFSMNIFLLSIGWQYDEFDHVHVNHETSIDVENMKCRWHVADLCATILVKLNKRTRRIDIFSGNDRNRRVCVCVCVCCQRISANSSYVKQDDDVYCRSSLDQGNPINMVDSSIIVWQVITAGRDVRCRTISADNLL